MNLLVSDFLDSRVDAIEKDLRRQSGDYALCVEKCAQLFENIEPIIHHGRDITISVGDCMDFCEYFEQEVTAATILQRELYTQGYLDCVRLLATLGVLA